MRKLLLAFAVGLSLAGCAQLQSTWNVVTGASVSPAAVYVARNSFDALEVSATNYISFCKKAPTTQGCTKSAINALVPAVRSGRVARNNLTQYLKDHPDAIGAAGVYDALVAATSTLQSVADQYHITGVGQ